MATIDYKEKYEKAVQTAMLAKQDTESAVTVQTLEEIFPELRESEDEKIRKAIIMFFELQDDNTTYSLIPKKDILAWLEKQREQKSVDDLTPQEAMDIAVAKCFEEGEQKPAEWSEEDEENFKYLVDEIVCLGNSRNSANRLYYDRLIKFIGELKDRAQPREEWCETDERKLDRLIAYFEDRVAFTDKDDLEYAEWLKSLKERVQPQPNQEWSEEDKNMLQSILDEYKSMPTEKRNWLKSLKDRYTWKPSDEQMNALNYVVNLMASSERPTENDLYYNILKSLRQQLMKLKG